MAKAEAMHIFFALNDSYSRHCCTAMVSILENNGCTPIHFHLLTNGISDDNRHKLGQLTSRYANASIDVRMIDDDIFDSLPVSINYISRQTYYRYAIAELYPDLDKAIYLDCDIVVKGSLSGLWATNLDGCLCAGVRDLWIDNIHYKPEIGFSLDELYINAGVLLLNLELMRQECTFAALCQTTLRPPCNIRFQDQDAINIVCRGRIKGLPAIYNFTSEDLLRHPDAADGAIIVHYTGERKPWGRKRCSNALKQLYFDYLGLTPYRQSAIRRLASNATWKLGKPFRKRIAGPQPLRIALLIDEFFGGAGTAYGGYGFLARYYIAKYLPCDDIQIDVLLGLNRHSSRRKAIKTRVDDVDVYRLPGRRHAARWLKKRNYDLYFSIELTTSFLKYERSKDKRLLLWVQDPRPWEEWLEIETVKLFPESCYWNTEVYELVHKLYEEHRVRFVTQGHFLIEKAKRLYRLHPDTPMMFLPNPVDIDPHFDVRDYKKKDHIIFIGRIESVKRGWLFCEIAKRMPEYQFFMLGQSFREKAQNDSIMEKYRHGIANLHFVGHVEGEEKAKYIRDAKILVNTSIHEALPVTFLEALAYGTLLVSCRNPEGLTEKFGIYTGPVLGDGFDNVHIFVNAIKALMSDDERRKSLSVAGHEYVKRTHNVPDFIRNTRALLREEAAKRSLPR